MKIFALAAAIAALAAGPVSAQTEEPDTSAIDIVDAIECRIDAPTFNTLLFALGDDVELVHKREWTRIGSKNPMLAEYKLPAPITVAGRYTTRRIAFTSTGVLAILDLPDPAPLARQLGISNAADPGPLLDALRKEGPVPSEMAEAMRRSGKFLGEKIVSDTTEKATPETRFGSHTVIARNVSTVTSHPGKTLYGCSYRITLLDKNGKPL